MQLVSDATASWNGQGTIRWAQSRLGKIRDEAAQDEQLVIFRGEDDS